MPPHISLSLSKTVFSLSRCTSPHPPAALVHECSVHSPPGVSAERKPDSQHCLPLKTPAAAFLPRGSAGTRGVGGGSGPPAGSDLRPSDTAPEESRAPGGTRTSNYAAEPRGRMEKRLWRERAAPLSKRSMDAAAGKKWLQFINPEDYIIYSPWFSIDDGTEGGEARCVTFGRAEETVGCSLKPQHVFALPCQPVRNRPSGWLEISPFVKLLSPLLPSSSVRV